MDETNLFIIGIAHCLGREYDIVHIVRPNGHCVSGFNECFAKYFKYHSANFILVNFNRTFGQPGWSHALYPSMASRIKKRHRFNFDIILFAQQQSCRINGTTMGQYQVNSKKSKKEKGERENNEREDLSRRFKIGKKSENYFDIVTHHAPLAQMTK